MLMKYGNNNERVLCDTFLSIIYVSCKLLSVSIFFLNINEGKERNVVGELPYITYVFLSKHLHSDKIKYCN